MGQLLKDILTCKDGQSFDWGRVLGLGTILVFLGLSVADAIWHFKFDHQAFGIGAGSTFAGVGTALKLKENSEPNKEAL